MTTVSHTRDRIILDHFDRDTDPVTSTEPLTQDQAMLYMFAHRDTWSDLH